MIVAPVDFIMHHVTEGRFSGCSVCYGRVDCARPLADQDTPRIHAIKTTSDMKRMAWSEALAVSVVLRVQVNQLGWVYPRPSRLVM